MKGMRYLISLTAMIALAACSTGTPTPSSAPLITTVPSTTATSSTGLPATTLLTNQDEGFALRFPAEYHVVLYGRSICFSLAQTDGPPGACHVASAFVDVSDAQGRTLETIADEAAGQGNPSMPVTRANVKIGGEDAVLLDDIYSYDVLRKVVILYNDRVYELTFVPWAEGSDAFPQIELLYSTLTESLTFLDQ